MKKGSKSWNIFVNMKIRDIDVRKVWYRKGRGHYGYLGEDSKPTFLGYKVAGIRQKIEEGFFDKYKLTKKQ